MHAPPIEPVKQGGELRTGHRHHPVADRRPFERAALQPLPDQHQARAVIDEQLHAVRSLRAEHENRAAEPVLLQDRLHRPRQPVGAAAEIDRARGNQDPYPRRCSEAGDHLACNRGTISPRNTKSTPGPARTTAPPTSISIAAVLEPARLSAITGTKSGMDTPASSIRSVLDQPSTKLAINERI